MTALSLGENRIGCHGEKKSDGAAVDGSSARPYFNCRHFHIDENNKSVGEVEQVLLKDGKVEGYIIDVGGWLGLGEKPVMVKHDQVTLLHDPEKEDFRIYIDGTKEKLENMPSYSG